MSTDADADAAARALLETLPLLNRTVAAIVQGDAPDSLTMPQFRALAHLGAGPLTVSDLARRRRVTMASMGELAQALVERGLVTRTPDTHDRRQQRLSLSEAGARRYAAAHNLAQAQIAASLAGRLSDDELAAVCAALPALQRALTETG
ncbi:MarR family transcriptional regulator [Oscillochloris sp. ZM17-4]|uniref:MarR family winged helix-turn-helix transcriptional regulator n=1 Tax=Oscillochloris sp. ZM17-4 TaxID=2866714 RepID=UPI001C72CDD4|nr:MarR family transcriptional regulator [Oscillochloris sp. ZM17-4]MBX0327783.1 MarR family transcriptional regulator [Oscillochloris sp. ZM17-4]